MRAVLLALLLSCTAALGCDGLLISGLSVHSRDRDQYNPANFGAGCVVGRDDWRGMVGAYYNSNRYWSQYAVVERTWEVLPGHRVGLMTGAIWYSHAFPGFLPSTRHRLNKDWELDTMTAFLPSSKLGVVAFYLTRYF